MENEQILEIVHQTAAKMMAAKDGETVNSGSMVSTEGGDNLIDHYGFSSIDALEFLLTLEKRFEITFEDEDLTKEVLSSATTLTRHIAALQRARASGLGR